MRNHSLVPLCVAAILLLGAAGAFAQNTGSVDTTLPDCGTVNGNVQYTTQSDLYIHSKSGLPAGDYYVRVIVPGGKSGSPDLELGSSSPLIALHVDDGGVWSSPITGASLNGNCLQVISILPGNAFDTTSNAGGEYQVEISTQPDFSSGNSKSDNFKMGSVECTLPDATITAPTDVCTLGTGTASVADAGSGATYDWSITNGSITSSAPYGNSINFTAGSSGVTTISVTVTKSAGCSSNGTATVIIDPQTTLTATGGGEYCATAAPVTLTATGNNVDLTDAQWTDSHGNLVGTGPSIQVSTSGTYTVTALSTDLCASPAPASATVLFDAVPTLSVSGGGEFCSTAAPVTLTASGSNVDLTNASWTDSHGNLVGTGPSIQVSTSDTYTVTALSTDLCGSPTPASATVTFDAPPTLTVTGGGSFCQSQTPVTLSAGGTNITNITWTDGNGNVVCTGATCQVSASTTLTVSATSTDVCPNPASQPVTVIVNPNPSATVTPSGPTTFCAGGSVTLRASVDASDPNSPFHYQWYNGSTPVCSDSASCVASAPGTYYVIVTDSSSTHCTGTSNSVTVSNYIVCACDLTQGAWGSTGGAGTITEIQQATAAHGPMVIGSGTHTFTLPGSYADAQCMVLRMPANATPAVLPSGAASFVTTSEYPACNTNLKTSKGDPYVNNGKFVDVLFGQTVTLWLGINGPSAQPHLANVHLCGSMTTQKLSGNVVDPTSTPTTFTIPSSVLTWLNANGGATVGNLLALADKALGGGSGLPSLSDINVAVTNVNQGFDSCRALISCN